MICFKNVSKWYQSAKSISAVNPSYPLQHLPKALSRINFSVAPQEMVFLTGHSGAGKSTILKLIMKIENPNQGEIFVNKKNITHLGTREIAKHRQQIGIVFQNPLLIKTRKIFDNVAMPLWISGFKPAEIKKRTHAALDKVGLLTKEKLLPGDLSSGEQQRIGIARAIVNKPLILLADEPTGNLDAELSLEIMQLFSAFNQAGVTVIIATHNVPLMAAFSKRLIALDKGEMATA